MEITRSREHTVNLANYENVRVGASVRMTDDEVAACGAVEDAIACANSVLDDLLREDLEEAAANVPEGKSTHLDSWKRDA